MYSILGAFVRPKHFTDYYIVAIKGNDVNIVVMGVDVEGKPTE